jgi:ketosteroid isomerase-like protein
MDQLTKAITDIPIALSSYKYPSYHPTVPWNQFLKKCDLNMPQVYWILGNNPAAQLKKSIADYMNLQYTPPILPTGAAFTEYDWTPTLDEVKEFMTEAKALKLPGFNFWEWGNLHNELDEEYHRLIRDFDWESGQAAPEDMAEKYLAALNSHDLNKLLALYQDQAVHITSERTIQGKETIKSWFNTLFTDILPESVFTLVGFTGKGNTRQINWTAKSSTGNVKNGSDTLGLLDGKIAYHFSDFSVIH